MTEGIIQKIFREYLEHDRIIYHTEFYNKETKKILFEIQQELIAGIKNHKFDTDEYFNDEIRRQLIGEIDEKTIDPKLNQEFSSDIE